MDNQTTVFAISTVVAFVVALAVTAYHAAKSGQLVEDLTRTIQEMSKNQPALDLAERLAHKVVPAELVGQIDAGAAFLKTLTPDNVDKLIDAITALTHKATDGQPNDEAQG